MRTGKKVGKTVMSLLVATVLTACGIEEIYSVRNSDLNASEVETVSAVDEVPEYDGEPYVQINNNQPEFEEYELTTVAYEKYSRLDELGRCGEAEACVGEETMPAEERESISEVRPTGWVNQKYDSVDGGYVYNRCHLIGFQLTGENANKENLITGTRYMNTEGMLPFENRIAEYIRETENHVMYRVTPVFEGEDLVASGVQMEAESVEDNGKGICFNIYVYNVQPKITIDYATGENWESADKDSTEQEGSANSKATQQKQLYIINKNTGKFHDPGCSGVKDIKDRNRQEYRGTRDELTDQGYEPCGRCRP